MVGCRELLLEGTLCILEEEGEKRQLDLVDIDSDEP